MNQFHRLTTKHMTLNHPKSRIASEWLTYPAIMTTTDRISYWMFYHLSMRRMFDRYLENMEYTSLFPFMPLSLPEKTEMGELGPV